MKNGARGAERVCWHGEAGRAEQKGICHGLVSSSMQIKEKAQRLFYLWGKRRGRKVPRPTIGIATSRVQAWNLRKEKESGTFPYGGVGGEEGGRFGVRWSLIGVKRGGPL